MLRFNNRSNLLDEKDFKYPLQDSESPNLFRDLFPYDEVPKIAFNNRRVPMSMPAAIWLTDTTFRDGQQSRAPYTAQQMVDLYQMMHQLGGPEGIIRQTEFFAYSPADRKAIEDCLALGYDFPQVTTWIRASKKDFELVKNIGIKETGILVSCSDYHIYKKLKMTRGQALAHYLSVVGDIFEHGLIPRCHFEDITRADYYGFVVPFVNELVKLSQAAGMPVKIRCCDTMGYGVPFSGSSLPRSVPGIIYGLQQYSDVPSENLEWHGHNDFGFGIANAVTAWLYGACSVNCSLLGIGERTGNVPLEAMVFQYAALRGTTSGMDTRVITEIARYFERELGYEIPPMTPFVGQNFNVTRAGIHADGLMKDEEIYNAFDTGLILNRPAGISINNVSGSAGIAYWINARFHLDDARKLRKDDDIVLQMKQQVDQAYLDGRVTEMSNAELVRIATRIAPWLTALAPEA